MLEPLTLALLALPGDPGGYLGHILLEHPEMLSAAGGGRGGCGGRQRRRRCQALQGR